MTVEFETIACVCEHAETDHDDGFGCTEHGCGCTAGWIWVSDSPSPGDW